MYVGITLIKVFWFKYTCFVSGLMEVTDRQWPPGYYIFSKDVLNDNCTLIDCPDYYDYTPAHHTSS